MSIDVEFIVQAFKQSPVPAMIVLPDDPVFTIVDANTAYLNATGSSLDDLVGKGITEAFPESPIDPVNTGVRNLLASLKQVTDTGVEHRMPLQKYDIPVRGTDQFEVRFWDPMNVPLRDQNGTVRFIMHTVQDVTPEMMRREAVAALEASRERLALILDSEPECVKVVSRDGKLVSMNPAGLAMIEADDNPDAVLGANIMDVIHPEDRESFSKLHKMALRGVRGEARFRITGLKGTIRHMESSSVPLADSTGTITEVLSVTRDITRKVQVERALSESEKRFRSLVQDGSDLIAILDIEGNYKYVSPTSETVLGIRPDEFIGKNAFTFIHEDDRDTVMLQFGTLQSQHRVSISPFRFTDRDGNWRWIVNQP